MLSHKKVDFKRVKKNIKKDNLDVRLIRIVYRGLTKKELVELAKKQEYKIIGKGKVLATYPDDFNPLFPKRATEILYLGA